MLAHTAIRVNEARKGEYVPNIAKPRTDFSRQNLGLRTRETQPNDTGSITVEQWKARKQLNGK